MKKLYKLVFTLLFISLILPNLAFASWWNPFSWSMFRKPIKMEINKIVTPIVSTTTSTTDTDAIIKAKVDAQIKATLKQKVDENVKISQQKTTQDNIGSVIQNMATPFTVSCSVNKTSVIGTEAVTWTAKPSDGDVAHYYIWSGDDGLTGKDKSVSWTYNTSGVKNAMITVTNSSGQTASNFCSNVTQILITGDQNRNTKQASLTTINLQIADLNAKYARDIAAARTSGDTVSYYNSLIQQINAKYTADYDALKAQYQQILYSN